MLVNAQLSGKWPFRVLPSSLIHLTLKTSASHPMKIFSVVLFILYIFFFFVIGLLCLLTASEKPVSGN